MKSIEEKLNEAFGEKRLRLGIGALSVRFGILSLKMGILRLEFTSNFFFVTYVRRPHPNFCVIINCLLPLFKYQIALKQSTNVTLIQKFKV